MKWAWGGRIGVSVEITAPLTEPTSVTITPGRSLVAIARPIDLVGSDRRTENHAIGVLNRARQIAGQFVAEPERPSARYRGLRVIGNHDPTRGVAPPGCTRHGRADEPYADDRQLFEYRLVERRSATFNHVQPA